MNTPCQQLIAAYRRQVALYTEARELVDRQQEVMDSSADPKQLLGLCEQVETTMAEIARIDEAIRPVKLRWAETREDPGGELVELLGSIEATIEAMAAAQENVQRRLLEYVGQRREQARSARSSVDGSRARRLYSTG
jgi:hypothetical protein